MAAALYPLYLSKIDATLKAKLLADAERRGASLNDVAVGILASIYGVEFEPNGGRARPGSVEGSVTLRMPERLSRKIHSRAFPGSVKREVERALSDHYGLRQAARPPRRRTP